eukprot:16430541-Heterocapsa_arctica.AAC.2
MKRKWEGDFDSRKSDIYTNKDPNILYREESEDGTRTTTNLSGSQTYYEYILENTKDHIILIQEHWRVNEDIGSWKSFAFRKGWHGVWEVAAETQRTEEGNPGRSGGVDILVWLGRRLTT